MLGRESRLVVCKATAFHCFVSLVPIVSSAQDRRKEATIRTGNNSLNESVNERGREERGKGAKEGQRKEEEVGCKRARNIQ